jgi:hypothetical protein
MPSPYHATLDHYMRQSALAARRVQEMRDEIVADALAKGATVTEIYDEIFIEYPDK